MEPNLQTPAGRSRLRDRLRYFSGHDLKTRQKGHSEIEEDALCVCFSCQAFYLMQALDILDAVDRPC